MGIHTGEYIHSCPVCKKGFTHKGSLYVHMRIHNGEKPFVCETCGKAFTQKGGLKTHHHVHTGEKPYICDVCGRGFSQSGMLKRHKRTHTGENPYVCSVCGDRFAESGTLKTHMVIQGYRLFLNYRYDMKKITLLQKQQGLESYKWKKPRRGRKYQGKAYPKPQWKDFIKQAAHRVAKMGIWLGFNFGLQVGELVHLRVQDIDLAKNTLIITSYNRADHWQPKTVYSERTIEFNGQQKNILAKWIAKCPTLTHEYLL